MTVLEFDRCRARERAHGGEARLGEEHRRVLPPATFGNRVYSVGGGLWIGQRRKQEDVGVRPVEGSFFTNVDERLKQLTVVGDTWDPTVNPITEAACGRAHKILWAMGKPTSVYPAISPDSDGGVSISWRAGLSSISIDVDSDGSSGYVHITNDSGREVLSFEFGERLSAKKLGQALDRLSTRVQYPNPAWRNLFS